MDSSDIEKAITASESQPSKNEESYFVGDSKYKLYEDGTQETTEFEKGEVRETEVRRELKPRHVSMIALGGTIGTGLFIGIADPLMYAGPVNALIAYLFMGSLVYFITQSLAEMATFIPIAGSFAAFVTRFLSPALGAANGYLYFFSWAITYAIELSVVGQVIEFWTFAVPLGAWIAIFFVILTIANFFPVKVYGEIEFWVAAIKVIAIIGFIIYGLCMVCGASAEQGPIGFRYWRNPGPWGDGMGLVSNMNTDRFLGWVSSLINAAFTYQGCELVGITAGETSNPRKSVPKAINKVIFRIFLFYILSLFFIGLLVPFNDSKLSSEDSYVASSPFIIAIENCGTPVLPHIFNAVIMCTIISAGNSNIYIGSRVLYALANSGVAPKFFTYTTKHGVPYWGVITTAVFGLLAFMVLSTSGTTVFNWFVDITAVAGLITWSFISIAHIRFIQVLKSRGISRDDLPFKARFMPWAAYYSAFFIILITFIQGYAVFFDFNASDFFTDYISLILFFVLWLGFQAYFRGPWFLPKDQVDIDTNRREIDTVVWETTPPKNLWEKFWIIIA
ncbi:hypothetical protein PACTADRAFT_47825 [Pachysolen tannophilus NRRL Y-2460]|uniref:Amino acid permease/ SLC12A domain-containing protein n=1 Tax=Pachysolen tannophilus NRRL Y-2460 TaxID=669874 RepID=A0A1E4U273_PACTA|nr:hypothetical protein PACTADRAFT_47825 [Pachysolen tannophilus NRRL Y-2460]